MFFRFLLSLFSGQERLLKTDKNIGFIFSIKTIKDISLTKISPILHINLNYKGVAKYCLMKDKYKAFILSIRVINEVRLLKKKEEKLIYSSLKLHLNDIYLVSMYVFLLLRMEKSGVDRVIANGHYQRWSFLASHISMDKFTLVQHGKVKNDIVFKYKFGTINELFCFNAQSYEYFSNYYQVRSFNYVKQHVKLTKMQDSYKKRIFIASTPVSVEAELSFIERFYEKTKGLDVAIYVKIHPLFEYKDQFNNVLDKVSFITDIYPYVDMMVTHGSSLGDEYLAMGQEVCFLQNYNRMEDAANHVHNCIFS